MKKITVICFHPSVDSANGYASAFGLYEFLSQKCKVNVLVPRETNIFSERLQYINSNMTKRNICIEVFSKPGAGHWEFYNDLSENISKYDREKLKNYISDSDIIICDSVYYVSLIKSIFPDRKIFFRSLDIEYDKMLYVIHCYGKCIDNIEKCFYFERKAYEDADIIFALTEADIDRLSNLYHIDSSKFKVIPICSVNTDLISKYIPTKRIKAKVTRGIYLSATKIENPEIFFSKIEGIKDLELHLVGKSCLGLTDIPSNVILHGVISEKEKNDLLASCDFALNITNMTFGMNVKMSDYFSLGIPVLSNKLGVRGYNVQEYIHYYPIALGTLDDDILKFCHLNTEERYQLAVNAFKNYCIYNNYSNYKHLFFENLDTEEDKFDCFIFGAKLRGTYALSELDSLGISCIGFIDNDAKRQGINYLGKNIYSFCEALEIINKFSKKIKIVIAVSVPYLSEIYSQVAKHLKDEDILIFESYSHLILKMQEFDINSYNK